jgi:hypothetical protein
MGLGDIKNRRSRNIGKVDIPGGELVLQGAVGIPADTDPGHFQPDHIAQAEDRIRSQGQAVQLHRTRIASRCVPGTFERLLHRIVEQFAVLDAPVGRRVGVLIQDSLFLKGEEAAVELPGEGHDAVIHRIGGPADLGDTRHIRAVLLEEHGIGIIHGIPRKLLIEHTLPVSGNILGQHLVPGCGEQQSQGKQDPHRKMA